MALSREQIKNIAHKSHQGRQAAKRAAAAPSPAQEKEHTQISHNLMRRRRAKQKGYL